MRPTLMGSLLDAARHNAHRNGPDLALFESGTVYRAREDGPGADEHHALGGAAERRAWRRRRGAGRAPRRTSSPPRRCSNRCSAISTSTSRWSAELALPAPRPQRRGAGRGRRRRRAAAARTARRAASARGRRVGSRHARPCSRSTSASSRARRRAGGRAFRAFGAYPPVRQDIAVIVPGQLALAELQQRIREAAGETLEQIEAVRRLHAASRWGRGAARWHWRWRSARRSGPSPTRTSPPCASGSWPRSRRWEASCVARQPVQQSADGAPRVLVAGRDRLHRGAGGAPRMAPPRLPAHGRDRPLPAGPAPGGPLPALPRTAGAGGARPRRARAPTWRRRSSPTRTRPPRRPWRRCASGACG